MIIIIDFNWKDLLLGGYTRSTSEPSALSLRVTAVGRVVYERFFEALAEISDFAAPCAKSSKEAEQSEG